jgi:hypothetical protein
VSVRDIASALETKLNTSFGDLPTSWENVAFIQPAGPYQIATVMFANPENPTNGDGFYRQRGFMQVSLEYPLNTGRKDIFTRAEAIRTAFKKGLSLTVNGITTIVEKTPEISNGTENGERYVVYVRIRFFANIVEG